MIQTLSLYIQGPYYFNGVFKPAAIENYIRYNIKPVEEAVLLFIIKVYNIKKTITH